MQIRYFEEFYKLSTEFGERAAEVTVGDEMRGLLFKDRVIQDGKLKEQFQEYLVASK